MHHRCLPSLRQTLSPPQLSPARARAFPSCCSAHSAKSVSAWEQRPQLYHPGMIWKGLCLPTLNSSVHINQSWEWSGVIIKYCYRLTSLQMERAVDQGAQMNKVRPWIFVFVPFNQQSLRDLFAEKTSLSLLLSLRCVQGFLSRRRKTLQETSPEDEINKKKNLKSFVKWVHRGGGIQLKTASELTRCCG